MSAAGKKSKALKYVERIKELETQLFKTERTAIALAFYWAEVRNEKIRLAERIQRFETWAAAAKAAAAHFDGCQACRDANLYAPCYEPLRVALDIAEKAALAP